MRNMFGTACLIATVLAGPALAVPIAANSQIDFTGGVTPIGSSNVSTATGLDFLNFGASGSPTGTIALNAPTTGTFAPLFTLAGCPNNASAGGCGVIKDITSLSPFAAIAAFYTITQGANTVTFNLDTLPTIVRGANFLAISGTGTFLLAGYDPTPAEFVLTTQGPGTTTFSATTLAMPAQVPEPWSLAVLGAGLVATGLGFRRRPTA